MGKIYCVMGKSSSGKDSIYSRIMQQGNPALLRIVLYTTFTSPRGRDGWQGICIYR